jgi:hypothetical protein
MKIRSINDVITNSSDETFVIKTTEHPEQVLNRLEKELDHHGDLRQHYSGMGGILETASRDYHDDFEYASDFYDLVWLPDNHVIVTIDYGWTELIEFLKQNYEVVPDYWETLVGPFLRGKADAALKSLEMMTKQEDIEKAYSEWKHWEELIEEYEQF